MKRGSGVLLHISSLPGEYGEGSFGEDAKRFVDFLADCGFRYWQTLPFCMPDRYHSPYKSFSAFSGNPNFIDLPALYKAGLLTEGELASATQNTPYACEFERLSRERMKLLAVAAKRAQADRQLQNSIMTFIKENPHLDDFCRFMEQKGDFTREVWAFTQYLFFTQWTEIKTYANQKGVQIIGDVPIYVDLDSSDLWADPELFQLDGTGRPACVAGVPPDYFCADGQLWGNPLYDWDRMKQDGYRWWRQRMEYMFRLFDGVRIDHFRAFESYFSVPATAETAREGKWVKGPGTDFVDCLKEVSAGKTVIAEDLGVITDEVRSLVEYSGFPGMRVLQFGFLGDSDSPHLPHNYPRNTVAYTGTHDNNTLLGYVWEMDPADRKRLLDYCGYEGENWDGCYDSIIRMMLASHADLVMMPIQDILHYGADTRMNRPGLGEGNWSYRITREQLNSIDRKKLRHWNELYGRI